LEVLYPVFLFRIIVSSQTVKPQTQSVSQIVVGVIQYPNSYWPLDVSAPAVVEHQNFSTTLLGQKTRTVKHGNTGARGPRQNQRFHQQRAMDCSTLAVFCEHRYFENGHKLP